MEVVEVEFQTLEIHPVEVVEVLEVVEIVEV